MPSSEPWRCASDCANAHSGFASGRSAFTSVSRPANIISPLSATVRSPPDSEASASAAHWSALPPVYAHQRPAQPASILAPRPASRPGSSRWASSRCSRSGASTPKNPAISANAVRLRLSSASAGGSCEAVSSANAAASAGDPVNSSVRASA